MSIESKTSFRAHTGDLAIVTGASSGIGHELARLFTADGYSVVVAAEDGGVHRVAVELGAQAVQADLATESGVQALMDAIGERRLAAAAINAGIGAGHAFVDQDLATVLAIIDLNIRGATQLAMEAVNKVLPDSVKAAVHKVAARPKGA